MDEGRESEITADLSQAHGDPELLALLDRPRWYWPEAVAWVCLRDLNPMCELAFMRRLYEKSRDGSEKVVGSSLLIRLKIIVAERGSIQRLPDTVEDAYELLISALEIEGKINATGRRSPTGERVSIPSELWSGAQIIDRHRRTIDIGSAFHAENSPAIWFHDIMIDRAALQDAFPDGRTEVSSPPLTKKAAVSDIPSPGRGRRQGTGIDDSKFLEMMHSLVSDGASPWDAAEKIAARRKSLGIKGTSDGSVQKRLHTKFKQIYPD